MKKLKAIEAMEIIVEALVNAGWTGNGSTETKTVRIPTVKNPVFGGIGGEVTTLGGRTRFASPSGTKKVTIGKQSTYFYTPEKDVPYWKWKGNHFKTIKDINEILEFIKEA